MAPKNVKKRPPSFEKNEGEADFFSLSSAPEEESQLLKKEGLLFDERNLSHAFLLEGPGETVRQVAKALIRRILVDFGKADPKNYALGACPDLVFLQEEKISIDQVRTLKSEVFRRPIESKYKVFFLEKAGGMLAPAQNALLKSLEEPPSYLLWILGVSNRSKLLPTIQSRCRIISLGKYPEEGLNRKEPISWDPALLSFIEETLTGRGEEVFLKKEWIEGWKEEKERFFCLWLSFLHLALERKVRGEISSEEVTFHRLPDPALESALEKTTRKLTAQDFARAIEETESIRQLLAVNINFQLAVEGLALRLSRLNR